MQHCVWKTDYHQWTYGILEYMEPSFKMGTLPCAPPWYSMYLQYQLQGTVVTNIAIFDAQDLHQPQVTTEFLHHQSTILSHMVGPNTKNSGATGPQAPAGGGAFGMSPQQFQEFINAMRGGHTMPSPAAGSTTGTGTVDRRWSINLESLMKLVNISDIQHLPPIWAAIAKGPHKEERNILQAALGNHLRTTGTATNAKLTLSKELLSTVVSLTFWSGDYNMLEEGLHPFWTVYISTAKQAQDQAHL